MEPITPSSKPPKGKEGEGLLDPELKKAIIQKIIVFVLLTPALSVMPLLRKGLGFRIARMTQIIVTTLFMLWLSVGLGAVGFIMGGLTGGNAGAMSSGAANSLPLLLLALIFLPLAVMQSRADWRRVLEGRPGSTYSRGVPRYAEAMGVQGDIAARWIDPLVCLVLSFVFSVFSPLLGVWLLMAGFALAIFEHMSQERYLNSFLDMVDGKYFAERMQQEVDAVLSGAAGGRPTYDGVVPSLPTVALKAIEERQREMMRRRAKSEPPPEADADPVFYAGPVTKPPKPIRYDTQTGAPIYEDGRPSTPAGAD